MSDGNVLLPDASGMLNSISRNIELASGDISKYKFICFDSQKKIRIRNIVLCGASFFMFALVYVSVQLGVID